MASINAIVIVLAVQGTGYDTLTLRIYIAASVGVEKLFTGRISNQLSLNVRTEYSCFLIGLPHAGNYLLRVVDISGRTMWDYSSPGTKEDFYRIYWNGQLKSKGTYIAILRSGGRQIAKRFVIVR